MNTFEIKITVKKRAAVRALLVSALQNMGISPSDFVITDSQKELAVSLYRATRAECQALVKNISKAFSGQVLINILRHAKKDWSTQWKTGWKPFPLTRSIYVVPLWQERRNIPSGKRPIFLETTSAFGTGLHETTRFTSQLIEFQKGKFQSFFDIGTGSGLLCIVAALNGARKIEAVDIDKDAITVARNNVRANGVSGVRFSATDIKTYKQSTQFDLVAANLITHDLLRLKSKIISYVRPGGRLIISGISLANLKLIKKEFGFLKEIKLMKVTEGKEWSALLFEKKL
nr:Ribosomal protein L11 methyltransferase [uncultured bacterium]